MSSISRPISVINRCSILFKSDKLRHLGLNGFQYAYILNICRNPGISQDKLAHLIYINKSTVTRQLACLEKNGFVIREQDTADKRSQLVYPTEKAINALPKIQEVLGEWNSFLTDGFTQNELDIFEKLLNNAAKKATEYTEEH